MSEIKIEKKIPIPGKAANAAKYPFSEMEISDSFFVPCENGDTGRLIGNLRSAAIQWGLRHGDRKFSVYLVDGGVRVWRVK